jgi:beta-RFAP synthase
MNELPRGDRTLDPSSTVRSVRITTGARLHFGLLDTRPPFGGLGVMIQQPVTEVVASRADRFDCPAEVAQRVIPIADRIRIAANLDAQPACQLVVPKRIDSHCGLGSGTQLSLAVAEAICAVVGLAIDPEALATVVAARGQRSAIGIHGYAQGGLIFEHGTDPQRLNPVVARVEVPDAWRVVVLRPAANVEQISGEQERDKFGQLATASPTQRSHLKTLAEQIVLAAKRCDFDAFAHHLHRYNYHSGRLFAAAQSGPYNGRQVTTLINELSQLGACGVGQSSWGPGVFAWFATQHEAEQFVARLPPTAQTIALTKANNHPRQMASLDHF